MAEPVDRRRFLAASTAAAAGTLLGLPKLEAATADAPQGPSPFSVEESPTGLVLHNDSEIVRITVCAADVLHVVASGRGKPDGASPATPWILAPYHPLKPEVSRTENRKVETTKKKNKEEELK